MADLDRNEYSEQLATTCSSVTHCSYNYILTANLASYNNIASLGYLPFFFMWVTLHPGGTCRPTQIKCYMCSGIRFGGTHIPRDLGIAMQ